MSVVPVALTLMLSLLVDDVYKRDAHDVYKRANFAPSDRCAASMHDNSADDLSLISYVHTVPKP